MNDVLVRDANLRDGSGIGALQRSLAGCLQRMGCSHLLQTYWRGVMGRGEGEASGKSPSHCIRMPPAEPCAC